MGVFDFFTGTPERSYDVTTSRLRKDQEPLYQQLQKSLAGPGAGGAFGNTADYYRDLLSDDSSTFNDMQAPEQRRFNEQIIPDLAEQFAGMGSGGLSSSGFRNAAVNAGTDLSERLGAIRAQLRQQGAQGLSGLGSQGLQQFQDTQNVVRPGTPGLFDSAAPAIGAGIGTLFGPAGTAIGGSLGNMASNWISGKGKSSPYGNAANAATSGWGR